MYFLSFFKQNLKKKVKYKQTSNPFPSENGGSKGLILSSFLNFEKKLSLFGVSISFLPKFNDDGLSKVKLGLILQFDRSSTLEPLSIRRQANIFN